MLAGDWTAFNHCHRPNWRDSAPISPDGIVSPPATARRRWRSRPSCRRPRTNAASCAGARASNATTSRSSRGRLPAQRQHVDLRPLHGDAARTPVTFDESNLLTAGTNRRWPTNNWAHSLSVGQQLGDRPDRWSTPAASPTSRISPHEAGRRVLQPRGRRHHAVDVGAEALPAQRRRALRLRQRDARPASVAEPVSDRQRRRR